MLAIGIMHGAKRVRCGVRTSSQAVFGSDCRLGEGERERERDTDSYKLQQYAPMQSDVDGTAVRECSPNSVQLSKRMGARIVQVPEAMSARSSKANPVRRERLCQSASICGG